MRTSPFAAAGNLSEVTEMMLDREIRIDEIVRRALVVACELVRVRHVKYLIDLQPQMLNLGMCQASPHVDSMMFISFDCGRRGNCAQRDWNCVTYEIFL